MFLFNPKIQKNVYEKIINAYFLMFSSKVFVFVGTLLQLCNALLP